LRRCQVRRRRRRRRRASRDPDGCLQLGERLDQARLWRRHHIASDGRSEGGETVRPDPGAQARLAKKSNRLQVTRRALLATWRPSCFDGQTVPRAQGTQCHPTDQAFGSSGNGAGCGRSVHGSFTVRQPADGPHSEWSKLRHAIRDAAGRGAPRHLGNYPGLQGPEGCQAPAFDGASDRTSGCAANLGCTRRASRARRGWTAILWRAAVAGRSASRRSRARTQTRRRARIETG